MSHKYMKKYLVYIETGGGDGDYICSNMHYTIVEGSMGREIVEKWCTINNIEYKNIYFKTDGMHWRVDGYIVRVIELIEEFGGQWKQLEWR